MTKSHSPHERLGQNEELKTSSDRAFGIVFTVVFVIIGLWPITGANDPRIWALVTGGLILTAAFVRPTLLAPGNKLWTRFGLLLHKLTNPIIMGLIFFLAVTPTALIMRALGKDPMNRKLDSEAETYWIDRAPPGPAPDSMTNQF